MRSSLSLAFTLLYCLSLVSLVVSAGPRDLRYSQKRLAPKSHQPIRRQSAGNTTTLVPLRDLQVQQPPPLHILSGGAAKACTVQILAHNFSSSYYEPANVDFIPPTGCGTAGSWAGVTLNITGTSRGTQYDRLSSIYIGNVEVWRTSTPEPTRTNGIIWTVFKDVTKYTKLFGKPTQISMNLNNVIDFSSGVDAAFFITLTATFYPATVLSPQPKLADVIIPFYDATETYGPDLLSSPEEKNISVAIPRNVEKAWMEITTSGNSAEEFWYWNIPDQYLDSVPSGSATSSGPFREFQLRIDGILAGVVWPYPEIYTGGINPLLWRPVSAYGSFVQPTYTIDVSPFLGLLSDGKNHTYGFNVAGMGANETNSNWWMSGNLQLVLSSSSSPTTGYLTSHPATRFITPTVTGDVSSDGSAVNVTTTATRDLTVSGTVKTGDGKSTTVVWEQHLSFSNFQTYFDDANGQTVSQKTSGTHSSKHNYLPVISDTFSFPLDLYYVGTTDSSSDITTYATTMNHSYIRTELGPGLAGIGSGSTITSKQNAAASLVYLPSGLVTGSGATSDSWLDYLDTTTATYHRELHTSGVNTTSDAQSGSLYWLSQLEAGFATKPLGHWVPQIEHGQFIGRLPGQKSTKSVKAT